MTKMDMIERFAAERTGKKAWRQPKSRGRKTMDARMPTRSFSRKVRAGETFGDMMRIQRLAKETRQTVIEAWSTGEPEKILMGMGVMELPLSTPPPGPCQSGWRYLGLQMHSQRNETTRFTDLAV